MWHKKGGRNRERKCCILCISLPTVFCTKVKIAKGGTYLWDTTVCMVVELISKGRLCLYKNYFLCM